MNGILERAGARQRIAVHILNELKLLERWSRFGTPRLIGAVAYNLVVAPDIDIEIVSIEPKIDDGFEVLRACAHHPSVTKTRFWNAEGPPHFGLYWQVRYEHEGDEWKIDMWMMKTSYDGPCGIHILEPMKKVLTDESRMFILELKEAVFNDPSIEVPSIQIYRAALDYGVRTLDELKAWLPGHRLTEEVTDWIPGKKT